MQNKQIGSENWIETLADYLTTFHHIDPLTYPGGYRAVMACVLADSVSRGLCRRAFSSILVERQ